MWMSRPHPRRRIASLGPAARTGRPAAARRSAQQRSPVVDVGEVEPRLSQELGQRRLTLLGDRAQLLHLGLPTGRQCLTEVVEHDVARDAVELHVASSRQEREALLDLPHQVLAGAAEQRAQAAVEPELATMLADEVEHRAQQLAIRAAQAAAELLDEQRRAVGRAQQQERVDARQVDALVEEVDGEQHLQAAVAEVAQRLLALRGGRVGPNGHRGETRVAEHARHVARMVDAHAEAQRAHLRRIGHVLPELREDQVRALIVAGEHVAQSRQVIALAAPPLHGPQIDAVVDAVVGKRAQVLLIDGVPQPQLGGDAILEPREHGQAVGALRSGGETEQLDWPQVFEQPLV